MAITFDALSKAYPVEQSPCSTDGRPNFDNQCAIRMGVCLEGAGAPAASFRGARCWHQHSPGHILRAEELAQWLRNPTRVRLFKDCAFAITRRPRGGEIDVGAFTNKGMVLFRNFWGQGNQGDHIDLWDGASARTGAPSYFARSEEVWFWTVG